MECCLIVTCASFSFLHIKKYPNSEKKEFTYKRLTCEEFLIRKTTGETHKVYTILITNSFPKIDKYLKTGF